ATRMYGLACLGGLMVAVLAAASCGDDAPRPPSKAGALTDQEASASGSAEAPTGFDNQTNGFEEQKAFDKDRGTFEEAEAIKDGLGPVQNATGCTVCHQNPVTGGSTQVAEIRAGRHVFDPDDPSPRKVRFEEPPGGSVIQQRAIDPAIQETVRPEDTVRTFRMSNTVLGNG